MYAFKIKLNPYFIIFPKVKGKDYVREINSKDLWIRVFWRVKFVGDHQRSHTNPQGTNFRYVISTYWSSYIFFYFIQTIFSAQIYVYIKNPNPCFTFFQNLEGILLQENLTSKYFGLERFFWRTKFVRDHHQSHINMQRRNFKYVTLF